MTLERALRDYPATTSLFRSRLSKKDIERENIIYKKKKKKSLVGGGKATFGNDGDDPDTAAIVEITFTTTFQLA